MDNRQLDITSKENADLKLALELAFNQGHTRATHYKLLKLKDVNKYFGEPVTSHYSELVEVPDGTPTLLFLWHDERSAVPCIAPMDAEAAFQAAKLWLDTLPVESPGDFDGSYGKGWRVFTEQWGHVAGHRYAVVAIQPVTALYGK